jgi:uncharacterized protein YidB (DUF937 family)
MIFSLPCGPTGDHLSAGRHARPRYLTGDLMSSFLNSVIGALGGAAQTGGAGQDGGAGGARGGADNPLARIAQIAMANPQLLQVVAAMFTAGNKHGGLQGMLQKFTQAGLGDTAQAWVKGEPDRAVSSREIEQVFGQDGIERIAQKSGTTPAETPDLLSQLLPALINGLTPAGSPPSRAEAPPSADALLGMLGGLLGRR